MSSVVIHLAEQSPVVKYTVERWHCRPQTLSCSSGLGQQTGLVCL